MQRGTRVTLTIAAAVAVLAAGAGAASAVLGLTPGDVFRVGTVEAAQPTPTTLPTPAPSEDPEPSAPAEPQPTEPAPTVEPAPEPEPLFVAGDEGRGVRDLQHRLYQIAWYTPPTSGTFDDETVAAVRGFQEKRGIKATGEVDPRTWNRLLSMTRQPTDDEMFNRHGPALFSEGDSGADVREIQARLRQIAWFFGDVSDYYGDQTAEAVRGFQAKRMIPVTGDVDQRTLDLLHGMTSEPTADELANEKPDPAEGTKLDPRCTTGSVLCIDKSTNSLRWVVDGRVLTSVDVRFGREGMETREGQFAVNFKSRDHVSSLYDTPMPFAMFFSGGQAVHYSPDFAANGYNGASHGCVNVRDYDAIASLYEQVEVGDRVVVYWS